MDHMAVQNVVPLEAGRGNSLGVLRVVHQDKKRAERKPHRMYGTSTEQSGYECRRLRSYARILHDVQKPVAAVAGLVVAVTPRPPVDPQDDTAKKPCFRL